MFTVDVKQQHNNNNNKTPESNQIEISIWSLSVVVIIPAVIIPCGEGGGILFCLCTVNEHNYSTLSKCSPSKGVVGWCDGAGKLAVPGHPVDLDISRVRACCACSRCGWGCCDIFPLLSFLSSFSLSPGDGPI